MLKVSFTSILEDLVSAENLSWLQQSKPPYIYSDLSISKVSEDVPHFFAQEAEFWNKILLCNTAWCFNVFSSMMKVKNKGAL